MSTIQRHWLSNRFDVNVFDGSYMVGDVIHVKSLSSGFIIVPNMGLNVNIADGSTEISRKEGNLLLAIIPDSISRKNTWLKDRVLGAINMGQFHYDDSQRYEFDVLVSKVTGVGRTIPDVGLNQFNHEAFVKMDSHEDAIFSCEVRLTIFDSDGIKQEFSPLLINLIKTRESTELGFHADDKLEV